MNILHLHQFATPPLAESAPGPVGANGGMVAAVSVRTVPARTVSAPNGTTSFEQAWERQLETNVAPVENAPKAQAPSQDPLQQPPFATTPRRDDLGNILLRPFAQPHAVSPDTALSRPQSSPQSPIGAPTSAHPAAPRAHAMLLSASSSTPRRLEKQGHASSPALPSHLDPAAKAALVSTTSTALMDAPLLTSLAPAIAVTQPSASSVTDALQSALQRPDRSEPASAPCPVSGLVSSVPRRNPSLSAPPDPAVDIPNARPALDAESSHEPVALTQSQEISAAVHSAKGDPAPAHTTPSDEVLSPSKDEPQGSNVHANLSAIPAVSDGATFSSSQGVITPKLRSEVSAGRAGAQRGERVRNAAAVTGRPASISSVSERSGEPGNDATRNPLSGVVAITSSGSNLAAPGSVRVGSEQLAGKEIFRSLDDDHGLAPGAWIRAGAHRAEAGYLDPALGWVGVHAETVNGGLHAALVPSSAQAGQFLAGQVSGLHTYLSETQTQSATVTVSPSDGAMNGLASSTDSRENRQDQPGGDQQSGSQTSMQVAPAGTRETTAPGQGDLPGGIWRSSGEYVSVLA